MKQELWYLILLKLISLGKPTILNQMPPVSISSLYCWSFLRQAQFRYRKWKLQHICCLIQGCYIYLFMHRQRLWKKSAISHKLMVNCWYHYWLLRTLIRKQVCQPAAAGGACMQPTAATATPKPACFTTGYKTQNNCCPSWPLGQKGCTHSKESNCFRNQKSSNFSIRLLYHISV